MYINKNKKSGFTLIEAISNIFILSLLLLILFKITNTLVDTKEKSKEIFILSLKTELLMKNIQKNLDVSLDFKITRRDSYLNPYLTYPKESLEKGNLLILKIGTIKNNVIVDEILVYHILLNKIYMVRGKSLGTSIYLDIKNLDEGLKISSSYFLLQEYGLSLEGKVGDTNLKKEFKK